MLFFVAGASGAGKTTALPRLAAHYPDFACYDFDAVGVPENPTKIWRQQTTEHWLKKSTEHAAEGRHTVICGGAVYGEALACPTAPHIPRYCFLLLDCDDWTRVRRLRQRGGPVGQHALNWASWQRMHARDPQWQQDVIMNECWDAMAWSRWQDWQAGDARWQIQVLDTSTLNEQETAGEVINWMNRNLSTL